MFSKLAQMPPKRLQELVSKLLVQLLQFSNRKSLLHRHIDPKSIILIRKFIAFLFVSQKNVTETLGDVLEVGTDATEEVARIGVKAIGAAPSILEQKIAFAQAQ